jgi:hypothetical protein
LLRLIYVAAALPLLDPDCAFLRIEVPQVQADCISAAASSPSIFSISMALAA